MDLCHRVRQPAAHIELFPGLPSRRSYTAGWGLLDNAGFKAPARCHVGCSGQVRAVVGRAGFTRGIGGCACTVPFFTAGGSR
jgi:hypothetical protein